VWITPGWYGNNWWRSDKAPINCTDAEMQRVLDRSLAVLQYPIVEREAITASGIVSTYTHTHTHTQSLNLALCTLNLERCAQHFELCTLQCELFLQYSVYHVWRLWVTS